MCRDFYDFFLLFLAIEMQAKSVDPLSSMLWFLIIVFLNLLKCVQLLIVLLAHDNMNFLNILQVPGLMKIRYIGQTTLGSAAIFGLFLGAGSLIHCGKSY